MNNNQAVTLQFDWSLLFGSMVMFVFLVGMIKIVRGEMLAEHLLFEQAFEYYWI